MQVIYWALLFSDQIICRSIYEPVTFSFLVSNKLDLACEKAFDQLRGGKTRLYIYMKGFVTKRDISHFWKAEIKGKNFWFFPLYLYNFTSFDYL